MQLPNEIIIPKVAEYIRSGYTVTLPLRGYSMRPYLEDGRDKALLSKPPSELKIGDVILAEIAPQRYALHRIVYISGDEITMYGDGNFSPEYIHKGDVMAIATGFYRKGSEHLTPVSDFWYKCYWQIWLRLRPLRYPLLIIYRAKRNPRSFIRKSIKKIIQICKLRKE
jgi:hypothetical protein